MAPEFGVDTFLFNQLVMRAVLDDLTLIKHNNPIKLGNG